MRTVRLQAISVFFWFYGVPPLPFWVAFGIPLTNSRWTFSLRKSLCLAVRWGVPPPSPRYRACSWGSLCPGLSGVWFYHMRNEGKYAASIGTAGSRRNETSICAPELYGDPMFFTHIGIVTLWSVISILLTLQTTLGDHLIPLYSQGNWGTHAHTHSCRTLPAAVPDDSDKTRIQGSPAPLRCFSYRGAEAHFICGAICSTYLIQSWMNFMNINVVNTTDLF